MVTRGISDALAQFCDGAARQLLLLGDHVAGFRQCGVKDFKALKVAIAEVHKSIALLKADDPAAVPAGTREGSFVVETLQVADNKLEKAVGL